MVVKAKNNAASKHDRKGRGIAPERDFHRVANSVTREAVPEGLFPATSKKLYDALYPRTRGAINPVRTVKARKAQLMRWAHIGSVNTFNAHVRRLTSVWLLKVTFEPGDNKGAVYEVLIPEEVGRDSPEAVADPAHLRSPQITSDQIRSDSGGRVIPFSGAGVEGQPLEMTTTYGPPKTLFKTKNNDDEENPFSELVQTFILGTVELTGAPPKATPAERARWGELARVIVGVLRRAAALTTGITSLPAFSTEHLSRTFGRSRTATKGNRVRTRAAPEVAPPQPQSAPERLTEGERAAQLKTFGEFLQDGDTLDMLEQKYSSSLHPDDWREMRDRLSGQDAGRPRHATPESRKRRCG